MEGFDLFAPEVAEDPYPHYRELREQGGVCYSASLKAWLFSRYDDVTAAFRAYRTLSSAPPGGSAAGARFLLTSDPPEHTALRKVVSRFFAPTAICRLEDRVREVTSVLVDEMIKAGRQGRADFMRHVADPLPVIVIAELMGIPADRRVDFKRWSDATVGGVDVDPRALAQATVEMGEFFATVIACRARTPGGDLISRLVEHSGDMTRRELQMFCGLLLIAGNETTTNLIGNLVWALLNHPDQAALLREDPGTFIPRAIEETMRFDAPVQAVWRLATRAYDAANHTVPAGARVLLLQGSANRDPTHYPDPDRFDLRRDARDHVGFGVGLHFCLGTYVARLEARLVLEALLDRQVQLRPAGPPERIRPQPARPARRRTQPRVRRNPIVRGLRTLPVHVSTSPTPGGS